MACSGEALDPNRLGLIMVARLPVEMSVAPAILAPWAAAARSAHGARDHL
jgi:hypothetical protein